MEIIDLLPSTPEMSAAQVWKWLKASGNAGQEVIRYTTERLRHPLTGAAEWSAKCSCTACGTEWHEPLAAGGDGKEHCGGNCIFFIRRADAPDVPFYTLQLDTHTGEVIQNRGEKNCARTAAVQAFENAWLREVVRPWILNKQKATKNFAAPAA